MVDLGRFVTGDGAGLVGRFVDGSTVRFRRLMQVILGSILLAVLWVFQVSMDAVTGFASWLLRTPAEWLAHVLRTVVGGGFARTMGTAADAATSSLSALGPLAFPAAVGVGFATLWAGSVGLRRLL